MWWDHPRPTGFLQREFQFTGETPGIRTRGASAISDLRRVRDWGRFGLCPRVLRKFSCLAEHSWARGTAMELQSQVWGWESRGRSVRGRWGGVGGPRWVHSPSAVALAGSIRPGHQPREAPSPHFPHPQTSPSASHRVPCSAPHSPSHTFSHSLTVPFTIHLLPNKPVVITFPHRSSFCYVHPQIMEFQTGLCWEGP